MRIAVKKGTPKPYGESSRKTIDIPPEMWKQIRDRMQLYGLDFAKWARLILQAELNRPAKPLEGEIIRPKVEPEQERGRA
jgi:hypothetical protein